MAKKTSANSASTSVQHATRLFNTGAAGFSVKVELCYEFGDGVHKMCLVLKWKVPFERRRPRSNASLWPRDA